MKSLKSPTLKIKALHHQNAFENSLIPNEVLTLVGQTYKSLCGPCPVCIFRYHHNLPFPRPCRRSGPFLTRLLVQHITLSRKVSLQPESNFFCYMLSECCVDVPQLIISVIMPLFGQLFD